MFKDTITIKIEVKEAITYQDVDEVGEHQLDEYMGGFFPVYVELVSYNNIPKDIIKGMNINQESIILATKHDYEFKRGDLVRLYGKDEYKVQEVSREIDPKFTNVVRMFQNSMYKYTWKIIKLG